MNFGRVVIAASAVVAAGALVGIALEVASPNQLVLPLGNETCASSRVDKAQVFGVGLWNESSEDLTLKDFSVGSIDGMKVVDTWVLPADVIVADGAGVGSVSMPDSADAAGWIPLDNAVIRPNEYAEVLVQFLATEPGGMATDFAVTYEGKYGLTHTAHSEYQIGYHSADFGTGEESVCGR